MGRVYAVASGKGGVGKTTTTVNLGAALAAAGHDVAVVDTDLGMANLAGAFGVDPSGSTIHDALAGEADVADATYEGAGGVDVIPGSEDVTAFARSDPEGLDGVLDDLSGYDFVLLDTGASLTHVNVRPLAIADEVLLVSTTERAALRDTERTRDVANRVGGSVVGAVLTRVDPANPNAEEVAATLDAKVVEVVPEDPAVGEAMAAGEPLAVHAPDSQAAAAYRRLAALLSGEAGEERAEVLDADTNAVEGSIADVDAAPSVDADADEDADEGESEGADADEGVDEPDAIPVDADGEPDDAAGDGESPAAESDGEDAASAEPDGDESNPTAAEGVSDATKLDGDDEDATASPEAGVDEAAESEAADEPADAEPDAEPEGEDVETAGSEADADLDGDEGASPADAPEVDEADEDGGADAGEGDEDDEGTVSETVLAGDSDGGLVEEAEPGDSGGETPPDASAEGDSPPSGGFAGVPDAESDANGEGEDEDDDEDGKGFFRRLLG